MSESLVSECGLDGKFWLSVSRGHMSAKSRGSEGLTEAVLDDLPLWWLITWLFPLLCGPLHWAAWVSLQHGGWFCQSQRSKTEQAGDHEGFHNLLIEITHHHFSFILLFRKKWVTMFLSSLKERKSRLHLLTVVSRNSWAYFERPHTILLYNFSSFCYSKFVLSNFRIFVFLLIVHYIIYILFL